MTDNNIQMRLKVLGLAVIYSRKQGGECPGKPRRQARRGAEGFKPSIFELAEPDLAESILEKQDLDQDDLPERFKRLTDNDRIVFGVLKRNISQVDERCHLTRKEIGSKVRMSGATVTEALKHLEAAGMIFVWRSRCGAGNSYACTEFA